MDGSLAKPQKALPRPGEGQTHPSVMILKAIQAEPEGKKRDGIDRRLFFF